MTLTRTSRRFSRLCIVLITLLGMLSMQFALAAYICPMSPLAGTAMQAPSHAVAMADCHGMDMAQPTLCANHQQDQAGSPGTTGAPQVPAFIASSLALVVLPLATGLPATADLPIAPLLSRSTAPPLAIRHCCFRI